MKYNLYEYLHQNLPAINFVIDQIDTTDPQESVLIREAPGSANAYNVNRADSTIQIVSFATESKTAEDNAFAVYGFLKERFNFTLPATGDGNHPAIYIQKISARGRPVIMRWEGSLAVYSFTYEVAYSDTQNGLTVR